MPEFNLEQQKQQIIHSIKVFMEGQKSYFGLDPNMDRKNNEALTALQNGDPSIAYSWLKQAESDTGYNMVHLHPDLGPELDEIRKLIDNLKAVFPELDK